MSKLIDRITRMAAAAGTSALIFSLTYTWMQPTQAAFI